MASIMAKLPPPPPVVVDGRKPPSETATDKIPFVPSTLEFFGILFSTVTKESFIDDGFFKTGESARMDEDGYHIILGRTSADNMKVGGYKLSALEIEAVLLEHPAIAECCVLSLPDKDYGEAVCGIVVPLAELKRKRDEELKPALTLEEL